jgi:hypothetical protein
MTGPQSWIDVAVLLTAILVAPAYACRIEALSVWRHRLPIVALHALLIAGLSWAAIAAGHGAAGKAELILAATAAAWIVVSYSTYLGGVPAYQSREHATPLQWPALVRGDDGEGQR